MNAVSLSETKIALQGGAAFSANEPPSEVEVVLVGDYKGRKGLKITDKTLNQIIANHKAAGVDPAIDRNHESWTNPADTAAAMGWVKSLAKRPSSADPKRTALVAQVEWTDKGQEAVSRKHWRYLSVGLDFGAKDRLSGSAIGAMLDHLALVKHPFVQHMEPLSMSAADLKITEEKPMRALLKVLGLSEEASEGEALTALSAKLFEKDTEIDSLNAKLKGEAEKVAKFEAEVKAAAHKECERKLDAKIAEFSVDPAEREEMLELAAKDPALFGKILDKRAPRNPSGAKLSLVKSPEGKTRVDQQEAAVDAELAADKKISPAAAYERAALKHPALFEEGSNISEGA